MIRTVAAHHDELRLPRRGETVRVLARISPLGRIKETAGDAALFHAHVDLRNQFFHFSDLFQQYLLADNSNLQDLFSKLGYSQEQVTNIPNEISLDSLSISGLQLSNEEKENLSNRYLGIIKNNLEDKTFSKEKNKTIEIDGKSVQVNAYGVTLTKEQLNKNNYITRVIVFTIFAINILAILLLFYGF